MSEVINRSRKCTQVSTLKIFRNDIDRVGVRDDCNLTMWSGDDFTGEAGHWTESDR